PTSVCETPWSAARYFAPHSSITVVTGADAATTHVARALAGLRRTSPRVAPRPTFDRPTKEAAGDERRNTSSVARTGLTAPTAAQTGTQRMPRAAAKTNAERQPNVEAIQTTSGGQSAEPSELPM